VTDLDLKAEQTVTATGQRHKQILGTKTLSRDSTKNPSGQICI